MKLTVGVNVARGEKMHPFDTFLFVVDVGSDGKLSDHDRDRIVKALERDLAQRARVAR